MDSVRFGRVLGIGARLAGKTLVQAVDAATAPNPHADARTESNGKREGVVLPPSRDAERVDAVRAARHLRETHEGVRRGSRNFGRSVWRPFAQASGVLWLEVTGVFFGLIALFGLQGLWMYRAAAWSSGPDSGPHRHFVLAAALALVFGYFCVTSFVRAARRSRG